MTSHYKDIVGYEGLYSVSDSGDVWSYRAGRVLKSKTTTAGYVQVCLYKNGTPSYKLVSRLVLEAFVGPAPSDEYQADHIDADPTNNAVSNLRWLSRQENVDHACELGHMHARSVVGFDENGNTLRFDSVKDAVDAGYTTVKSVLSRRSYQCQGYAFVYEDEWPSICPSVYWEQMRQVKVRRRRRQGMRPIPCTLVGTHVKDGSVVVFHSLKEAREAGYSSVALCLRGKLKTCGNRIWEAPFGYEPGRRNSHMEVKG